MVVSTLNNSIAEHEMLLRLSVFCKVNNMCIHLGEVVCAVVLFVK